MASMDPNNPPPNTNTKPPPLSQKLIPSAEECVSKVRTANTAQAELILSEIEACLAHIRDKLLDQTYAITYHIDSDVLPNCLHKDVSARVRHDLETAGWVVNCLKWNGGNMHLKVEPPEDLASVEDLVRESLGTPVGGEEEEGQWGGCEGCQEGGGVIAELAGRRNV